MRAPLRLLLRALGALVLPAATALLYTQASACGAACTPSERLFDRGVLKKTKTEIYWATSPIDGPFILFEGATTYRLKHTLGVRPDHVTATLSFSERPEIQGNGGSAEAAGNLALVLRTSEDEIVIKSDTCASYFIRVEAWTVLDESDAGTASDAGGDAASDVATDTAVTDAPAEAAAD